MEFDKPNPSGGSGTSGEASRTPGSTAQALAQKAAGTASAAGKRIKEFGSTAIEDQKRRAADEIGIVSSAIRRAGDKLHEDKDSNLAEYAEAAAEQVDRVERYLRERPIDQMYSDLQGFARRRPEMLIGGMFIAGVALARFLKASRPDNSLRGSRFDISSQRSLAAGPLVSPNGEPLTPNFPPHTHDDEPRLVLPDTSAPEGK